MIIIDRGGIDFHTNVSGVLWLAELQDPEIKLSRFKVLCEISLDFLDFIIRYNHARKGLSPNYQIKLMEFSKVTANLT